MEGCHSARAGAGLTTRISRGFLEKFHDQSLIEAARSGATEQKLLPFIPRNNEMLDGLGRVLGTRPAAAPRAALRC